jgi:hypothetical protein
MNTKTMTVILAAILMGGIAQAQDWSWTFQRWGATCGLLFEDVTLTPSVKAAIRDDISKVYVFTTTNNLFTRIYTPNDSEYGTFDGFDGLQGNNGTPNDLGGWDYKTHNGNRYFHVKTELSERYLQQITLTNQHNTVVKSLGNFLTSLNSLTTNNLNTTEYIQLWWSMGQKKTLSRTFSMEQDDELFFESDETIKGFCWNFTGQYEVFVPTILLFKQNAEMYDGALYCNPVYRKRSDGTYETSAVDIAYCGGKWHLVLPEF